MRMRGAFTAWMRPEPLEAHALALPLIVLLAGAVAKGRGGSAETRFAKAHANVNPFGNLWR
jgi:hypothetical protein